MAGRDGTDGPDLALLAALDAGLLNARHAATVRAAAAADPRSVAALEALAATRAELAALPDLPVPPAVAGRWTAALDAAAARPGRVRSRPSWIRPALVAAALLALLAPAALDRLSPPATTVDRLGLTAAGRAAVGVADAGDLAGPARRSGCLLAVAPPGVAADAPLLGGRRVQLDGRPGVLLVLGSGELGVFHVVVVDPGCGPEGGVLLGRSTVGR